MEDLTGLMGEERPASNEKEVSRPAVLAAPLRPCRITFDGLSPSEAPRIEVRAWLDKLGALTAPMTGGHVVIESVDDNRTQLRYRVHMQFTMPDGVVMVALDHPSNGLHEDIYVAIRNGFRAARRQLELYFRDHPVQEGTAPGKSSTEGLAVIGDR
jgi:hypothetical protein